MTRRCSSARGSATAVRASASATAPDSASARVPASASITSASWARRPRSYLGLTEAQLHEQLRAGKSLAQIAKDKGKSTDGLKKALHDAVKEDLDAAVKAGRITQAQADEALARFDERADDLINRTPGEHPRLERMHADARVLIF